MTTEKSYTKWYFLSIIVAAYIIVFLFNKTKFLLAINSAIKIFISIIPTFLLIFILMALINYFVKPESLVKHMGKESGIKGWVIAIIAGIISSGPIYMWYPMLNDLQKQGMRNGLIVTFLYNRAVKIPLLPLLISYFGIVYSITLLIVMIVMSVIQGRIVEKILEIDSVDKI